MKAAPASIIGLLAMCGCATNFSSPASQTGTCGAEKVASYIGADGTDANLAKIKAASGAQTIRVVGPHDAMTMDYRLDRLTVETEENGKIKRLRCV